MVALIKTLAPDMSTDATFRTWGSEVSSALTAMGIPKTTDTGQIDWVTVVKPTAINTPAGYEIRKFNDTLQATAPVFFKLEYGAGSSIARPALFLTVGTASNGSGTLSGQLSSRLTISAFASSTTLHSCLFSGTASRMGVALFTTFASAAFFFAVERTKDITGTDTAEGILLTTFDGNNVRYNQFIPYSFAVPAPQTESGILVPFAATSGNFGADVGLYPNFFFKGGIVLNPGVTHLGYFHTDFVVGSLVPVPMYGTTRSYYCLGNNPSIVNVARGGVASTCVAMLYE